jgi:dienelactone hydrolase
MPFVLQVTAIVLLCAGSLFAQGSPMPTTPGDAMIESHLILETRELNRRFLNGARSKGEWESQRELLKRQFFEMLGLWPLPERTALKATVTGTIEQGGVVIEKVHFQSKPGLYVTGNVFRPAKIDGKLPAVLYVCGHTGRGRDGNKSAFQHHGMWFAAHGYVCLIVDTLQLGEIAGIHHGTYNKERWWWQSAGYTPAGVECWNGIRALDYLVSRPDVDAEKLAVTGISGGGAATFWIAAADERVKVCVPVSGMSDLQTYVDDKVCNGHCDCMFLYNTYRWEWTTIAALVAPRAMLFENSGHDPIFPMVANERIRERLSRLYQWYEKQPGDLFDLGVTPGGHFDNVELRLMAYRWINRHLKGDNAEVSESAVPVIDGKRLRVFPEEADLPSDSLNAVIDESFVPRGTTPPPKSHEEYLTWSSSLIEQLEEHVFREWPDQVPAAEVRDERSSGQFVLGTEDDILVLASRHEVTPNVPRSPEHRERLWLVVLNADEPETKLPSWVSGTILSGQSTVTVGPRGCGVSLAWSRKNPPNYVERAHALLGRTVDAGRVYDIQSVARWLHEAEGNELTIGVAGRGPAGVLGAYAALFESSISEVLLVEPPVSHRAGPTLLNVLRILDIPDTIGLLAPRHVTIVNGNDDAFDRTAAIFKAAGYESRLSRSIVKP